MKYLSEKDMIDWAQRVKASRGVSYAVLARVVSPLLGRADNPVSCTYIYQALNHKHPTNGMKVAKAIVGHYEGIQFEEQIYLKVA